MFNKYKSLKEEELHEVRKLNEIVATEKLKLICIGENTLLFEGGQALKKQQETLVGLLEQKKNEFVGQLLAQLGYPPKTEVNINTQTGKITIYDRPPDSK